MEMNSGTLRARLLAGVFSAAVLAAPMIARAADQDFNIAPQSLDTALADFSRQSMLPVLATPAVTGAKQTSGYVGASDPQTALAMLLLGTGLTFRREGAAFLIVRVDADPQSGSAAGDGADQGTVQALIVTAQKREEQIQDVPIAISAFTEKTLEEQKIEGGFDLLKAIPNVTFSKNNFTSYNFSIRGVGTKAISATTDPGVAVSFNNVALIQNRLFEQEYFDIERVEVLRGPQGTLYGRNATAGVINVISAKPNLHEFDGWVKGEVGNYHTKRVSAMVNVPLVEDKLAIRVAGALTDRQGYDFNEITGHAINGRDLWSGRITVAFKPTDSIRSNLIWEHFEEDDDRSRTGKQLCHRDPGPTEVDGAPVTGIFAGNDYTILRQAMFSQGCKAGSLYDSGAFDTPNGLAEPFVFANLVLQYGGIGGSPGSNPDGTPAGLLKLEDPYGGLQQSHDLRTIASIADPKYRAKADVLELNVDVDLTDHLTFTSQTAYDKDQVYSFQDFNRFNTEPVFNDSSQWLTFFGDDVSDYRDVSRGGQFCDPQLGCSNRMVSFDISQAKSQQFSQEIRLQSDFDGPVNFSVGANYTRFNVLVDYYVFNNLVTSLALFPLFNTSQTSHTVALDLCGYTYYSLQTDVPVSSDDPRATCPYIDLTSIDNLAGDGHNYFRSKNPYKLSSAAAFGEVYWQLKDNVKLTAGLRYTDDKKTFTPVPSQILLAPTFIAGGTVSRGYPELAPIKQHWGEWTGRLGVDWKPDLSFTDQTMLYAFYSRGYKGGGANPPSPGFANHDQARAQALADPTVTPDFMALLDSFVGFFPTLTLAAVEYGPTFKPEFVNAFEVGAKNTLLGGALTFNTDAFFYDYKDYQVSQIRDRTAVNENFDARTWGLEFETTFAPSRHLQFIANLGYLDTKIAKGMKSIDIMNRTQGNPDWMVVKPWMQYPSNCIAPVGVVKNWVLTTNAFQNYWAMCGKLGGLFAFSNITPIDPATDAPYDLANYPQVNGGAGFYADLGGNELPNAPHWTANLGTQYSWDLAGDWTATVRGDAYWQSQSWARVYNSDPYDKLHGWYNVNLSVWFERPDDDLKIELYAKNLLDKTPITDAFLNSDDSALTTNVFVLDPRLIGLSIRKGF
jgi:outer membrane receptor protein involved in Fe transport